MLELAAGQSWTAGGTGRGVLVRRSPPWCPGSASDRPLTVPEGGLARSFSVIGGDWTTARGRALGRGTAMIGAAADPRRLAHERHPVRVATEMVDVGLHPLERQRWSRAGVCHSVIMMLRRSR